MSGHSPPIEHPTSRTTIPTGAKTIGVILVNWNGWKDTVNAFYSLERSTCRSWTLIVVDNASTDDSATQLATLLPSAVLIRSEVNGGFAGGCNLGLRKAKAMGLDYAFLLNNDAEVVPDTLDVLVAASAEALDKSALGAVVKYWPSGTMQFFGSRTDPVHGGPSWYQAPADIEVLKAPLIDSDFLIGAALFMPMELLQKVGELDERFFLTYEETDWCYRARALGYGCHVVSSAVVHHAGSASLGGYLAPMQSYFLHRNRLLFSEKHASARQRVQVFRETWGSFRADLRRSFLAARSSGMAFDPSKKAMVLAMRDYLLRRFGDCPSEVRRLAKQAQIDRQPLLATQHDQAPL